MRNVSPAEPTTQPLSAASMPGNAATTVLLPLPSIPRMQTCRLILNSCTIALLIIWTRHESNRTRDCETQTTARRHRILIEKEFHTIAVDESNFHAVVLFDSEVTTSSQ